MIWRPQFHLPNQTAWASSFQSQPLHLAPMVNTLSNKPQISTRMVSRHPQRGQSMSFGSSRHGCQPSSARVMALDFDISEVVGLEHHRCTTFESHPGLVGKTRAANLRHTLWTQPAVKKSVCIRKQAPLWMCLECLVPHQPEHVKLGDVLQKSKLEHRSQGYSILGHPLTNRVGWGDIASAPARSRCLGSSLTITLQRPPETHLGKSSLERTAEHCQGSCDGTPVGAPLREPKFENRSF